MDGLHAFAQFLFLIAFGGLVAMSIKRGNKDPNLRFCLTFLLGFDVINRMEWESLGIVDWILIGLVSIFMMAAVIDRILALRDWRKNRC
ncbi:MAG: hypothetical protein IJ575_04435 [Selenomonadaceae bacterium]|nr:hypothetical protein [Selenomonadaceae bacterium]